MRVDIRDRPSLDDLAKSVRLSRRHLSRLFHLETGLSPKAAQRAVRMERARHLLMTSHLTIKEVAASCGFMDASHLVRKFARVHRMSPTEYRNAPRVTREDVAEETNGEDGPLGRHNG
jgi:transcriptional regulator GlxA family with amidase domain